MKKIIVITGGNSGLGKAVAKILAGKNEVVIFGKNIKEASKIIAVVIGIGMLGYMLPNCYQATLSYIQNKELQEYQNLQSDYQHLQRENRNLQTAYQTLERKIQDSEK